MPVSSSPRSTGLTGAGSTGAPARAAIPVAATSACCAAITPCLSGNWVASPAAYTSSSEPTRQRSEEHTSELQSPYELVCRLLPEKNNESAGLDHSHASNDSDVSDVLVIVLE